MGPSHRPTSRPSQAGQLAGRLASQVQTARRPDVSVQNNQNLQFAKRRCPVHFRRPPRTLQAPCVSDSPIHDPYNSLRFCNGTECEQLSNARSAAERRLLSLLAKSFFGKRRRNLRSRGGKAFSQAERESSEEIARKHLNQIVFTNCAKTYKIGHCSME